MPYIASYLNDYRTTKIVNALVDETQANLKTREGAMLLKEIFPTREYETRDFLGYIFNDLVPEAKIIGFGQEIPVARTGNFRKITADMVKIAISYVYNEEMQWKMYEAMKLANLQNITIENQVDTAYVGKVIQKGANNDLARQIFGDIQSLVKSVVDKFDALTYEVIQTGQINYTKHGSNIPLTLDFLANASYDTSLHFPADLVATGNPQKDLNIWSDAENADGVKNVRDLHAQYIDTNGFSADYIIMRSSLYYKLQNQATTKDYARATTSGAVGVVSPDLLNYVWKAFGLPPIKLIDDKWQTQDNDTQASVNTNLLQDNRVTFVKKDMGIRAIGVTMESSNRMIEDGGVVPEPKPGIFVETYEKSKDTIMDVSRAIMTGLPVVPNPKHLMSRVVDL